MDGVRSRFLLSLIFVLAVFGLAPTVQALAAECPEGISCRTVKVPLDWSGKQKGQLQLKVNYTEGTGPLLLFLAGGPGQSITSHTDYVRSWFDYLAPNYRIAVMDQRGTGGTAIKCDRLQRLPLTDLTVRPRSAVKACSRKLGAKRSFYSTASTVRDMEAIRKAISVDRMAVMGTSYGTYVATRYARAYPSRVSRLILDSVVPQEDVDPFLRVHMRRAAKVLRWECGQGRCGFKSDPAADLAKLIRMPARGGVSGPALLDWVTTIFSFAPKEIPAFGKAIHRAANGDYRALNRVSAQAKRLAKPSSADSLSWGLHAATLCTDANFPFSIRSGNRQTRTAATRRYLARSPDRSFWPFTRATAIGNGIPQVCFDWQPTKVAPPPEPARITQPVLFLAGQYDLSTPVEYAKREFRRAPKGKLVVIPKMGHASAFSQECSISALTGFLRGRLKGDPCRPSASRSVRTGNLPVAVPAFQDSFLASP